MFFRIARRFVYYRLPINKPSPNARRGYLKDYYDVMVVLTSAETNNYRSEYEAKDPK